MLDPVRRDLNGYRYCDNDMESQKGMQKRKPVYNRPQLWFIEGVSVRCSESRGRRLEAEEEIQPEGIPEGDGSRRNYGRHCQHGVLWSR